MTHVRMLTAFVLAALVLGACRPGGGAGGDPNGSGYEPMETSTSQATGTADDPGATATTMDETPMADETATIAPDLTGTPMGDTVGICHRTGSETNPYVYIEVNRNAVRAHEGHGDLIGVASAAECPGPGTEVAGTPSATVTLEATEMATSEATASATAGNGATATTSP